MKKNIYKLILSFAALSLVMSCEDDDSSAVSPLPGSNVAITVSSVENNVTVMESAIAGGMTSYTITATIAQPQVLHYIVNLDQTAGNATLQTSDVPTNTDDINVHQIIISPGDTSASTTIDVYSTGDIESNETFTISASVGEPSVSRLSSPFNFSGTITDDYVNDVLNLSVTWDGQFMNGDLTLETTCSMDYDLVLSDDVGNIQGYISGGASCIEAGSISGLADGTYFILADLYDNPLIDEDFTDVVPLILTYSQEHFPATSGTINNSSHLINTAGSIIDGNGNSDFSAAAGLAIIEVSGYNYTVTGL